MKVAELMHKDVRTVDLDATVNEAVVVAEPLGVVTVIGPVVAPEGTLATI